MVVGDAAAAEQLAELLRPEEVSPDRILEILLPVEADRARNVGLGIQIWVLVYLDDADRIVAQMLHQPVGLDEHVLCVTGHRYHPSTKPDRLLEDYFPG